MNRLFTAEHIHAAYVVAVPGSAKPWDEVAEHVRHLYEQMAHSLNTQEAIIRAWRELQSVPSYVERHQRAAQEAVSDGN